MAGITLGGKPATQPAGDINAPTPAAKPQVLSAGGAAASSRGLQALGAKHGGRRSRGTSYADIAETELDKPTDITGVLSILVQGDKDSSKTCGPVGLPVPDGTARHILTYDETSKPSIETYYGRRRLAQMDVVIHEMVSKQKDDDGKEVFPGFDPNVPWTGESVVGETMLLLDELDQSKECGLLYMDHFQALYEGVIPAYVRHANGLDPLVNLQIEHYAQRTQTATLLEAKVRRVPVPGGIACISGYAPEEKIVIKKRVNPKPGERKVDVVTEVKAPSWLKDNIRRNWLVTLHTRTFTTSGEVAGPNASQGNIDYVVDVLTSKVDRFRKGARVNITNKDFGVFWQPNTYDTALEQVLVVAE